jgi:enoyl-CoA hydratase
MYEHIEVTHPVDHVAVITIDRPEVRNALSAQTYAELDRAVSEPGEGTRCIVLTGADPTFCSGDDLRTVSGNQGSISERLAADPKITVLAGTILRSDVPTIAAVNGAAVGWGMELALLADLRVASERARFGELFVLRGLCCDVAGLGRLVQLVGREVAAELLLTGAVIDAAEARSVGLVRRVVPHEELLPEALQLAQRIAANPPLAVARIKQGLRRAIDPDWEDLGAWVSATLAELFQTQDHREGVRAFLEKREATYVGA